MTINDAIDYFLINQKLKGNTETTINNYSSFLGKFRDFVGAEFDIQVITALQVNKYNIYLRDKGHRNNSEKKIKMQSVQTYLRHLKVFFRFLHSEGLISLDIASKVILPKAEKPVIEILSDEEIGLLLSSFNLKTELGSRNHALCFLMLDCGLRSGEACNMKISDINFKNGYITVNMGKGGKSRIVPVGLKCRKIVSDYLYKRRLPMEVDSECLFLSKSRGNLTVESVSQMFSKLSIRIGIPRLHAHLLRHTFATNFLLSGSGDIFQLSQLLGHEDVKTTQIYLHVANYYKIIKQGKNVTYMDKGKRF